MSYVRTRIGRWFYEERGAARRPGDPAIVLCHGILFDGGMWRNQIEPLAELGRVLVFDGPGHGKSEAPPRFSLEDHADAMTDAFGEIGVGRAIFVGLSWGGMVAMRAAIQHPSVVHALALFDTSADAEPLVRRVRYRAFAAFGRRFGLPPALVRRDIAPLLFAPRTITEQPDLVARMARTANGFDRDGLSRAALAVVVHRKSIVDKIDRIRVPTLVVVGREDRATPLAESEVIVRKIAGARLAVIDEAGHSAPLERPRAVNDVLVPFVREQMARA